MPERQRVQVWSPPRVERDMRLARLLLILAAGLLVPASQAAAAPSFQYRGVIEGFYGAPWAVPERESLLRWMGEKGMNTYIHAPKNDPYQRLKWRSPYPDETIERFRREVAVARQAGLAWIPSVSPGSPLLEAADPHDRDICFSCPADRQVLFDKLDRFWSIGVRTLMVSFDDVIKVSTHPEDAAAYGAGEQAYGVMNADLLNAVYERYASRGEPFELLTVPADYFGATTTPYLEGFRSRLREEIKVMWTGVLVVSPTIDCEAARGYGRAIGRKPILWDNFPVNDYAPDKLVVGPYKGRAKDLPDCLEGIVANPANQVKANRIPLGTVADYLRDPAGYEPEASWERSLRELAGPWREALGRFVENVRSTPLDRTEAVDFERRTQALVTGIDEERWPEAYDALSRELGAMRTLPDELRSSYPDQQLVRDFDRAGSPRTMQTNGGSWLSRLSFTARNAQEAADAIAATRPAITARRAGDRLVGRVTPPATPATTASLQETVRGLRARDDGNPPNVFGDRAVQRPRPDLREREPRRRLLRQGRRGARRLRADRRRGEPVGHGDRRRPPRGDRARRHLRRAGRRRPRGRDRRCRQAHRAQLPAGRGRGRGLRRGRAAHRPERAPRRRAPRPQPPDGPRPRRLPARRRRVPRSDRPAPRRPHPRRGARARPGRTRRDGAAAHDPRRALGAADPSPARSLRATVQDGSGARTRLGRRVVVRPG
jgi:hyaluronoglucosaminidase